MKPVRVAGALVALVVLAGSVFLTVARLIGSEAEPWVLATSFVPWAEVGYLVALVLFALLAWRQSWGRVRTALLVAASVSLLGLGLHTWWLAPSYVGEHATGKPDVIVVELNMLMGRGDPADTAALIRREHPDVLVLTEATPGVLAAVEREHGIGAGSPLPHVSGHALPGASGVVVASRFPLTVERTLTMTHTGYLVRVQASDPFEVLAVHAAMPAIDIDAWRRDQATILRAARVRGGPYLVVGDFNATLDHPPMRTLLADGLTDAAGDANSGWQPTWPSPERVQFRGLPTPFGLFAIDHVLMSTHFSAVSTSTAVVRDSDHRALIARLVRR
jgi:endonuclease/exonuclease/phosphatase (EEP) superfamily protein YafD